MTTLSSPWLPKDKRSVKVKFFKKKKSIPAAVQTAPSMCRHNYPFSILEKYNGLSNPEIKLYKTLKESVPIIDAAISKILRLTGEFRIECEDKEIEKQIDNFITNVQVNSCSKNANNFILSHLNQLLTYGTAIGEIVLDSDGENIAALYNSSLSNIELRCGKNPLKLEIFLKNNDGTYDPVKYPELILISTLNPDPGYIYGNSIMKGLPFISNILLKIYHSIGINWERLGNIRFAVTYKPTGETGDRAYSRERATQIASEWSKAMQNSITPSDFITIGDVSIKVIGADNPIMDSQVPVRQMLEQIVSKLSIPPFLLGLNWSTTETMSTQQAEILSSELESYRRLLNPVIKKICDTFLMIKGIQTEYKIIWNIIDLKDQLQIANTRLTNARALEIEQRMEKSLKNEEENR